MRTVVGVTAVLLCVMVAVGVSVRVLDQETHRYGRALNTLDALDMADTSIHSGVLKARAGLTRDYDHLVDDDERAWSALARLRELGVGDATLTKAIEALEQDYRRQSEELELFKSQNALLGNSLAYFWRESSARMLDGADDAELRRLGALASAMHRLNMDSRTDTQAMARTRLEEAARDQQPSALLQHGRMLLDLLPATDATLRRLRPVDTLPSYLRVRQCLQQRGEVIGQQRLRLRWAMLAMGVTMVGMLMHLTVLLRRRARTLRRRAEFDRMMVAISRDLIGCERADLDRAIAAASAQLGGWLELPYAGLVLERGGAPARIWPEPEDPSTAAATAAALALPPAADEAGYDIVTIDAEGRAAPLSCAHIRLLRDAQWTCLRRHSGAGAAMLCFQRGPRPGGFPRSPELLPLLYSALDTLTDALVRRRLEDEANALERRLERARRMETIGAMASGISHNFNNIVGAIRANAEAASATLPTGVQAHAHLVEIDRATGHASDLIDAILGFGRAQNHNVQLVELDTLLQDTLSLLRVSLPATVEFDVQVDDGPLYVQGSPSQLQQVILNLASNAAQAMRLQGTVSIRLARDPAAQMVRLRVADHGIGIAEDMLERIFDPFYTTRDGGTGLGLATVRQIVGNHEGRIEVRSRLGAGTTFVIELPRCIPDAALAEATALPGHRRLLVLCDERAALEHLEDVLAALGHEPVGHLQVTGARRMLLGDPAHFDAIVVQRQAVEGLAEALHALHAAAPGLPLLLLSRPERVPSNTALQRIISEILGTPYSPGALALALERLFAGRDSSAAVSDTLV